MALRKKYAYFGFGGCFCILFLMVLLSLFEETEKISSEKYKDIEKIVEDVQDFDNFLKEVDRENYMIVSENIPLHLSFLEIGTSDFDTFLQTSNGNNIGMSVEPMVEYLKQLPKKKNILKVNAALGDAKNNEDFVTIYYIPQKIIEKYEFPNWLKGCNKIGKRHLSSIKFLEDRGIDHRKVIKSRVVPLMTLEDLIDLYEINEIDIVKIDTEGTDGALLSSLLKIIRKEKLKNLPKTIIFERNFSLKEQKNIVAQFKQDFGYSYRTYKDDGYLELS